MEIAFDNPTFWIAVLQIIAIDILLGGDNAVVIALACRNLPPEMRKKGIFWGVAGAIGLRVVLTIFAVSLLTVPYLKLIGAALLFWIGIKLILPEDDEGHEIEASTKLLGAIKTIIVADAVMSLDNVIAVAAAAKDSFALIVFGLLVSIPIIVYCSTLVLKLINRFPWVIVLGGGLLGWIAAGMAVHDVVVKDWVVANAAWLENVAPPVGAVVVMAVGKLLASRMERSREARVVDLADQGKT
jgi:YjbE family integral membrane protein